jgi:hypothetical protein
VFGAAGLGAFASSGDFEGATSAVFVPDAGGLPETDGNSAITNQPITAPNAKAMAKPEANHPTRRVG